MTEQMLVHGCDVGDVYKLRVGADRRVSPLGNAPLLRMMRARRMYSIRLRGGCLALVPKSPVHTGIAEVAGLHFRLPALALNIPPRIALAGWLVI